MVSILLILFCCTVVVLVLHYANDLGLALIFTMIAPGVVNLVFGGNFVADLLLDLMDILDGMVAEVNLS